MQNRKKYPLAVFFGVLWAFLITGYIAYTVTLFLSEDTEYITKPEYIIPYISAENYGSLYSSVQSNIYDDTTLSERADYTELLAITDYAEAAFRYKAYADAGNTEMADICESKMQDALSRMNELSFAAEGIDKAIENIK